MASTVRVDERVHAALREIATEERRSIGQVIAEAVRRHQKETFWSGVREDFARLKADPAAWRDDQAEVARWDQTVAGGLEHEAPHDNLGRGGGRREGATLVHSNDVSNRLPNGRCFVAPITGTDRGLRIHLRLAPPEGGLSKPSVIVCDQAGAKSLLRFKRRRGVVSPETLAAVQTMLGEFIDR